MSNPTRSSSGFSVWRRIAEELRQEIVDGGLAPDTRLPSEAQLAERFAVNRNTVRQAVASLVADRLVVARRGSGTFVAEHTLLVHRIGVRTRLRDSLRAGSSSATGILLEEEVAPAPPPIAERLGLGDRPALRLEIVRAVDGRPISRATGWFDAERVPELGARFRECGSITVSLQEAGIADYVRASTVVAARHATATELTDLALDEGAVVLAVQGLDTLPDGTPLQFASTRFPADRVELDIEQSL
ncbi:phosphonate metabolism transcriptional regulator PhnF [Gordonia sp. HY442]|uniref:phosphonate metabolism transcriptional regulator PhnF n=1 Tax=Gordonia zhenghanii TaxID=2911516 RepID=UPI001F029D05|nr:phosphonate metabolism transcriptional regulator PhnF [Gordonia zhenghanii]MCF8607220.1 phosphonate metabolism transcriptional regulator PhnF [Gordonia zhenghanii]